MQRGSYAQQYYVVTTRNILQLEVVYTRRGLERNGLGDSHRGKRLVGNGTLQFIRCP
jgi:hypothetical protein